MKISELTQDSLSLFRQKIEQTLSDIGMKVEDASVRDACQAAGCLVRGERVLFPSDVLHALIAKAPSSYSAELVRSGRLALFTLWTLVHIVRARMIR